MQLRFQISFDTTKGLEVRISTHYVCLTHNLTSLPNYLVYQFVGHKIQILRTKRRAKTQYALACKFDGHRI